MRCPDKGLGGFRDDNTTGVTALPWHFSRLLKEEDLACRDNQPCDFFLSAF